MERNECLKNLLDEYPSNTIYRASTPILKGRIKSKSLNMADIVSARVVLKDDLGHVLKIYDDPIIDPYDRTISVKMTQEDTLLFPYGRTNIQVRLKLKNEAVLPSKVKTMIIRKSLDETIL